jgi:signal transduction histidine kinase
MMLLYTYMHYGTDDFVLENQVETLMKLLVMIAAVVFVIIAFYQRDQLMTYLATGTTVQLLFYSISLFLINRQKFSDGVLSSSIFYFEAGVVAAVIFFLLGITYKNRQELITKIKEQEAMKLEAEKKGFETQLAVLNAHQEERNRISADMHDDLGSGMTAIRLYSELARNRTGEYIIPEIDKISNSANELLVKMNAIIWSMSSSNDTLGNTVAYIRAYAKEYLEESNIEAIITLPAYIPDIQVEGAIRRNIFLVVKEALHNIVKHAEATVVEITLVQLDKAYSLEIKDNGKGFDIDNIREFSNGLKNMKKRMDDVDIEFEIENDRGTTIRLYRILKNLTPS